MRIRETMGRLLNTSLFVATAACGGGTGPDLAGVARVDIDPQPVRVELQDHLQLSAVLTDEQGNRLNGTSVHWSTEDPGIAEVSSTGVITGKTVGTTRVAASVRGVDGLATVTVVRPGVAVVSVSPNRVELREGESRTLAVSALDRLDQSVTGITVQWSTADPKVAQVSSSGRVTAVGTGTTKVSASVGGVVGESTIEVSPRAVDRIDISPGSVTLDVGNTRQLNVTLEASDGTVLTNRPVAWSSSDPKVASVSSTGLVTANAQGSATIKAIAEGREDTASVRVRKRGGDD